MSDSTEDTKMARNVWEIVPTETETVPPYTTTNTIFYGRDIFVVIDPGPSKLKWQEVLADHIEARCRRGDQFLAVAITHHHVDHSAGATYLSERFSVPIYAHKNASVTKRYKPDRILNHHDQIILNDNTLTALFTPGHAEDHLTYFDEHTGVLIAGDMITDRGTILIPPGSGSLRVYLHSLNELTKLPLKTIIPAHGLAITEHANQFLIKAMRHRYQRIASVLQAIEDHPTNVLDGTDITMLVYGKSLADNLLFYAQLSVESSLYWLKEAGLVDNPDYTWRHIDDHNLKQREILEPLKEIDERLRNA